MKEEISAFIFPQSYFTKGHKASRVGLPSSSCGILKMSLIWTWCARAHLSARHWCGRHGGSGSQGHPWLQTESHPSWNTYILSQKKQEQGRWRRMERRRQRRTTERENRLPSPTPAPSDIWQLSFKDSNCEGEIEHSVQY